jgi:hypothetical protein
MSTNSNIVLNPSKINSSTLNAVDHNYCASLWQSQIVVKDGLIIYHEPMHGDSSYTCLQLVPLEFYNIIFIAFHSNAIGIGGHFNAYRTLHRICISFYWPGMYSFITCMCNACPGCALANPTKSKSSVPFLVFFVDTYDAGKHSSFDGFYMFLVACCGMTGFASMEPIQHANSKTFVLAIMRTELRYGVCHTIILDKDSKFYSVCQEALDLLQINCHVLSGDNHNPMMVERINWYLAKGLKIMTNEQDSVRIALKAILLLFYAWNSCPIQGTDISRNLVAIGHEFAFSIDYSTNKHWKLTSSPSSAELYSQDHVTCLFALCEVAQLLIQEQHAYHWKLVNLLLWDPYTYSVGNVILPGMMSIQMLQRAELISFNALTLDHGTSQQFSKALCTNSSIAPCCIRMIKSMPQTYHRTPSSSSLSNLSRALTINMVNSTNL